ncbi:PadR family transcriptional regulator [Niallia sp. Krafla_26]|uniref:PadR family transcriptional regulator n=1 Tax=Niallia sp. Krafla_26 TaxID=3064703 RepID=UPI003D16E51F
MEDRLKGLRKSMEKTTFKQLTFSKKHRLQVYEKIKQSNEHEEDILLALLQLLIQEKTGYELVELLRARGIRKFEDNEGLLYIVLHRLEQNGFIQSNWDQSETKYYQICPKGTKVLRKMENSSVKKQFLIKELIQE